MTRFFQLLPFALILNSCAGLSYAVKNYGDVEPIKHPIGEYQYRIFDKPDEHRMMIAPTPGRAMKHGFVSGVTFGGVDVSTDEEENKAVARDYLNSTGRKDYELVKAWMIVRPQWEVTYQAPGSE